jgi:hypothetical protein
VKEVHLTKPESFNQEGDIYAMLQHLQGCTILIYYGEAKVKHTQDATLHEAHLLELVQGITLSECTIKKSIEYDSKTKINSALALFSDRNVVQGDSALRHFIQRADRGLKVIDFGEAYVDKNAKKLNQGDALNTMYWFSQKFVHVSIQKVLCYYML